MVESYHIRDPPWQVFSRTARQTLAQKAWLQGYNLTAQFFTTIKDLPDESSHVQRAPGMMVACSRWKLQHTNSWLTADPLHLRSV